MNNVKLLHIKCCFFQFFNSPVALKNTPPPPQEQVEMTPLHVSLIKSYFTEHAIMLQYYTNYGPPAKQTG